MEEKTIEHKVVFEGRAFSFCSDKVLLPNGKFGIRDYVAYPEAVAILAINEKNEIVMVEQFRYPVKKVMLEIPAGKVDDGELPLDTAKRELAEEAGLKANKWIKLVSFYPALGYSSEKLHIFLATELSPYFLSPDEDEFINVKYLEFDDVIKMIEMNQIEDPKTIIGVLFFDKFVREKL